MGGVLIVRFTFETSLYDLDMLMSLKMSLEIFIAILIVHKQYICWHDLWRLWLSFWYMPTALDNHCNLSYAHNWYICWSSSCSSCMYAVVYCILFPLPVEYDTWYILGSWNNCSKYGEMSDSYNIELNLINFFLILSTLKLDFSDGGKLDIWWKYNFKVNCFLLFSEIWFKFVFLNSSMIVSRLILECFLK